MQKRELCLQSAKPLEKKIHAFNLNIIISYPEGEIVLNIQLLFNNDMDETIV